MYYEINACLVSDNRLSNRPSGNSTKGIPHVSHIRSRCHCFYHLERKVHSAYLVITRGECRIPVCGAKPLVLQSTNPQIVLVSVYVM